MTDVVLDSGPLSMWAAADRRMLAILEAVQRAGGVAFVPTVCLVESLTGRPQDAHLHRLLKGVRIVPLDASGARGAAERRATVDSDDVADPVVVATAARLRATIVSTDPDDMRSMASAMQPEVLVLDPRD